MLFTSIYPLLTIENIEKNIPLFFQKRHDEFLKTSNVFFKTTVT